MSSREEISQLEIEPPISSLKFWISLHHHLVVWGYLRPPGHRSTTFTYHPLELQLRIRPLDLTIDVPLIIWSSDQ